MAGVLDDAVWMLRKRLAESGRQWPQDGDGARWLRWAMVMGATRLLRRFQDEMPGVAALREACWRERHGANIPNIPMATGEGVFLRLGLAFMVHHLVRKPEFGPDWNAAMAQRLESRRLAEVFEKTGKPELARKIREAMPEARERPTATELAALPVIPAPQPAIPAAPAAQVSTERSPSANADRGIRGP